ncbi:MAG: HAMP domain-containing histidine kinase [Rhizobacter sp.]|nr:HAMP domain-containing histidine kinase [Chlorobiales bacterium]
MKRRWSIFLKLIGVMAVAVVLINLAVFGSLRLGVGESQQQPPPASFARSIINYAIAEIGVPPDTAKARDLADKLDIHVRWESEKYNWASSPAVPRWAETKEEIPSEPFQVKFELLRVKYGVFRVRDSDIVYTFSLRKFPSPASFYPERTVLGLVVMLSLVIVGLYFVLRRMFDPISVLIEGTNRISGGDFSVSLDVKKRDELGQLASSFNAMSTRIAAMLRRERELLLDVSHELRSPLTRMNVALELLPEGSAKSQIKSDIAELNTMLTELLESERLISQNGGLRRTKVDLAELTAEVVGEFWDEAPRLRIETKSETGLLRLNGDRERLRLLLRNLISNALKYSQAEVAVMLERTGDRIWLSVNDQGVGIADAELEKIFEPFYRTDASRARVGQGVTAVSANTADVGTLTKNYRGDGFGLGLHLCKRIAEAHGGTIAASSSPRGTVITAVLPVAAPDMVV